MFSQHSTVPKPNREVCIPLEDTDNAVRRVIGVLLGDMPAHKQNDVVTEFERQLDRRSEHQDCYTVEKQRFFVGMRVQDAHLFVDAFEDAPHSPQIERPISQWLISISELEAFATYEEFETRFFLEEEQVESGRYPLDLMPVVEALMPDLTDIVGLYRSSASSRPLDKCFGRAAKKMRVNRSTKSEWSCIIGKALGLEVRLRGLNAWVQGYRFELAKKKVPQGVYTPMGMYCGAPYISLTVKPSGFRSYETVQALSVATALGQTVYSTIVSQ